MAESTPLPTKPARKKTLLNESCLDVSPNINFKTNKMDLQMKSDCYVQAST